MHPQIDEFLEGNQNGVKFIWRTRERRLRTRCALDGSKRNLAKRLVRLISSIQHETCSEAFIGRGGVFLRRSFVPKCEVIIDFSGDVANLFRILQRHFPQFLDCLKFQIASRREFERLQRTDPSTLTDLEQAARFLYWTCP